LIDQEIQDPSWVIELGKSERDSEQPLLNAGAISSDNTKLFVSGGSGNFHRIDAFTGDEIWLINSTGSEILAEPLLVESQDEQSKVFVAETSGTIRQHNIESGEIEWSWGCKDLTGIDGCDDSIVSEISASSDGNFLYYGDVFGRIVCLRIATFVPEPVLVSPPSMDDLVAFEGEEAAVPEKKTVALPSQEVLTQPPIETNDPITSTPAPSNIKLDIDFDFGEQDVAAGIETDPTIPEGASRQAVLTFIAAVTGISLLTLPFIIWYGQRVRRKEKRIKAYKRKALQNTYSDDDPPFATLVPTDSSEGSHDYIETKSPYDFRQISCQSGTNINIAICHSHSTDSDDDEEEKKDEENIEIRLEDDITMSFDDISDLEIL